MRSNKIPDSQKIDPLQIQLVTGRIQDVIDFDGIAGVELDTQCASPLVTIDDTRLGKNRDCLVTQASRRRSSKFHDFGRGMPTLGSRLS